MSIKNYMRPQLTIKQLLDRTPDAVGDHINALIIGAEYFLNIYDEADIPGEVFTAAAGTQTLLFTYSDQLGTTQSLDHNDYIVDEDSVRVFGEDLEAIVASFGADGVSDSNQFIVSAASSSKLTLTEVGAGDGAPYVRGTTLAGELDGRNVAVGDNIRITDENGIKRTRKVIGFASSVDDAQKLDQILLDGPAVGAGYTPGAEVAVETFLVWSGEIANITLSDPISNGVVLASGQSLQVTDKDTPTTPFTTGVGKVYLSYRALEEPVSGEGILTINSASDIADQLGTVSLHNDLAFAANEALSGSQGKPIKVLKVASDDLAGFTAALRKVETTDMVYALAPITTDLAAIEAVVSHAETMSNEVNKKFRRVYFGTDSPGDFLKASKDTAGSPIVIDYEEAGAGGPITQVSTASQGINFLAMGLVAGDYIMDGATKHVVDEVLDDTTLLIETARAGGAAAAVSGVEFFKADTPQSQIEYVADISKSLGSRRAANIWTEGGTRILNGETTRIPNRFIAAEIAGLRSALLPQQGLTRTEINSITDAPEMYIRYTPGLLDGLAADGVYIILQEVENGDVFVRHQLTTDVSSGSLYYEDSVGTNLDNISYVIKDTLVGYIGRRNVNRETLDEIFAKMFDLLKKQTLSDRNDTENIGPALIAFEDLVVEADDVLKDRVNVFAQAIMPLPLNNLAVTLQGSVAVNI